MLIVFEVLSEQKTQRKKKDKNLAFSISARLIDAHGGPYKIVDKKNITLYLMSNKIPLYQTSKITTT